MTTTGTTTVATLAAVALIASGCRSAAGPAPGQGMPPTPVALASARAAPIEETTEYVATLKSLRSTTIQPQVEGQITRILVKSGDRVRQGAPLMEIDARRQQAAVSSQQAELVAAEATVSFAKQQQQRSAELFRAGAISKQALEQAETELRTAVARLEALQAQVRQQQVQLRYFTVTSPAAGIVGDVPVRVGHQVTPQTVLTTVDQNDVLEIYVSVPIERAPGLRMGLPMQVWNSDGSERIATTAVNFISPHADEQTQSVLVKGAVHNPDGTLRSSQYVRARIVWNTANGLVVPVTAVLRVNGQFFAFVAEEAGGKLTAKQRPIKVGPIVGDNYPVLEGLKPGDRVVVSGAQKLADGVPIAAQGPAPAPRQPSGNHQP